MIVFCANILFIFGCHGDGFLLCNSFRMVESVELKEINRFGNVKCWGKGTVKNTI